MTGATKHPYRLAIGGLIGLATAMGVGRFVYTPILPVMVDELGLTKSEVGFIASANFLGYLAGALIAAVPNLAGTHRRWLIAGLASSALTTGLMGMVSTMMPFLLLRFAGGVASAIVLVFSSALVLDRLAQAGRSNLASLHFSGVGTGIAVSAVLTAVLVSVAANWQMLWYASAIASAVATVLVVWLIADEPDPVRPQSAGNHGAGRSVAILIGSYGLYGFGYVITATFIVAIVRSSHQIAALEPAIWLIVGLAAIPSIALWAGVASKIGNLQAYAAACLIEAFGIALSVVWQTPAMIILSAVLFGGTFMGIVALGIAAARRLAPHSAQRILALMTASFGLGQIIGPAFAGIVHDVTGDFVMPTMTAALALVIAAAMSWRAARG